MVRNLPINFDMAAFEDFVDKMKSAVSPSDPGLEDPEKKEKEDEAPDENEDGDKEKDASVKAEEADIVEVQHLIQGEISRTKGSIPSVGFLKVKNEEVFYQLIEEFARRRSPEENKDADLNPAMSLSPYHRLLKPPKKSYDKMCGTYEKDVLFKAFMEEEAAPVVKLESAEKRFQAAADEGVDKEALLKKGTQESALMKFMKEQAQKTLLERRATRAKDRTQKGKLATFSSSKDKKGGPLGSSSKRKDGKLLREKALENPWKKVDQEPLPPTPFGAASTTEGGEGKKGEKRDKRGPPPSQDARKGGGGDDRDRREGKGKGKGKDKEERKDKGGKGGKERENGKEKEKEKSGDERKGPPPMKMKQREKDEGGPGASGASGGGGRGGRGEGKGGRGGRGGEGRGEGRGGRGGRGGGRGDKEGRGGGEWSRGKQSAGAS